jgi:hypothetical protein
MRHASGSKSSTARGAPRAGSIRTTR